MAKPETSRAEIRRLITRFYRDVRENAVLGPVFERRIGTSDADWAPHLAKIEDFWANVMLRERAYSGNPMQVHAGMPEIELAHFAIWLDLFENAARAELPPASAEAFNTLARRIGASLSMGLAEARGGGIPRLRVG